MLIKPCSNTGAVELCMPLMTGWSVTDINVFFSHTETDTYEELYDYVIETAHSKMRLLLEMIGDELRQFMR